MSAQLVGRSDLDDHPITRPYAAACRRTRERECALIEIEPFISQVAHMDETLGLRIVYADERSERIDPTHRTRKALAQAIRVEACDLYLLGRARRGVGDALALATGAAELRCHR